MLICSPEPKAHWWARIGRPLSSIRMYVCCEHFQTSSPLKPLSRFKPNFMWNLLGTLKMKFCSNGLGHMIKTAALPIYSKNLKNLLLRKQKADDLETWSAALSAWAPASYSNNDPELTLTYFTARSNLVPCAFVWGKGNTIDFSETIVIYDLKLATDDRSDKKFLLTSKFCPPGLYAPCPGAIYMY